MTTEVRTNIFTSSEPRPLYCMQPPRAPPPSPLQIHRVIPLTQIIDFFFSLLLPFLKIFYAGAWKCQGRHAGSKIYWEFIDHQKLLSKAKERREEEEGKKGKSPRERPAHRNATAVSHFTPEQELIWPNLHIRVFAQIQSNVNGGADTIRGFKAEYLAVFQL